MNKERRARIDEVIERLAGDGGLQGQIEEVMEEIENLSDEEQEYFDNMPASFQQGDKGCMAEAAVDNLTEAHSALEQIDFDDIKVSLEAAAEHYLRKLI